MYLRSLLLFLLVSSSVCAFSHGAKSSNHNEWNKETLTLRMGDNWSTERCLDLSGPLQLEFKFESPVSLKFDLHMHPKRDDGAYSTVHFAKENGIYTRDGKINADFSGVTCFDFFPVGALKEDALVHLQFRYF